jgi:hypothetical protein
MPSQLVVAVAVTMVNQVVAVLAVLLGVGLLQTQLALLELVARLVLLVTIHAMETLLLAVAHSVVQVQLVVQELWVVLVAVVEQVVVVLVQQIIGEYLAVHLV